MILHIGNSKHFKSTINVVVGKVQSFSSGEAAGAVDVQLHLGQFCIRVRGRSAIPVSLVGGGNYFLLCFPDQSRT
jgi:hypothetical protein